MKGKILKIFLMHLNWSVLDNDYNTPIYYHFYNKIKMNFNRMDFPKDMDFLSEKLTSIVYLMEDSKVLLIYFAILKEDIYLFQQRKIDTSRFIIIDKDNQNLNFSTYVFLLNFYSNDNIINDTFTIEQQKKINDLIMNKKINQLIGVIIKYDIKILKDILQESKYANTYPILEHSPSMFGKPLSDFYENSIKKTEFYFKKNDKAKYSKVFIDNCDILLRDFYINYSVEYDDKIWW